jgi:catechol 2,3-dioxygenase-like lactoylglutathione lyase family enzyme
LDTTGIGGLELGDKRRVKRLISTMKNLADMPRASIPNASEGWPETKAAYRLLSNKAVDAIEILTCHAGKSEQRAQAHPVVLCLQDTTELDFTSQPGIAGLGRLSYEAQHGMYAHLTLMVTPQRLALGVLDAWMWAREPKGQSDLKESTRWKDGYTIVADTAERTPGTRFVYVADREADIRELMNEARERNYAADFLLRAKHNRNLAKRDENEVVEKLWEKVAKQEPQGQIEFMLEANGERKARKVCQTLYALRATLPKQKDEPELEVTAILAREENPPAGVTAIEWRLLTNRQVTSLEQAAEMVDWYRCRWLIEIFFRILKSGCRVEARQLASMERLERLLVIYFIIAWRILHVVTLGQECPNLPCDVVFDTEEWQAAWIVARRTKPPEEPPLLGDMVRLIARFGGFLGRKCDGSPGPKAIWEGMEKVRHYAVGIEVGKAVYAT